MYATRKTKAVNLVAPYSFNLYTEIPCPEFSGTYSLVSGLYS